MGENLDPGERLGQELQERRDRDQLVHRNPALGGERRPGAGQGEGGPRGEVTGPAARKETADHRSGLAPETGTAEETGGERRDVEVIVQRLVAAAGGGADGVERVVEPSFGQ